MSIRRLRARLIAASDSGISMIEVLVALMVFSILAVGMLFALTTMTRLSGDTENREIAVSLAAQEIDKVRAVPDAFNVLDSTTTQTVSNIVFTITRTQAWVSTTGSTASCGGGGGNLQYKSVDVKVSWANQLILKKPVEATTALAPASRINDPSYGTIIVSVLGADGTGRAGIVPVITPAVGTVDPTDSDGCSYVLKVKPGTYTIKLNQAGYIDYTQTVSPSKSYPIIAGSSQPVSFNYDKQANYALKYASNFAGTAKLPDSLTTNFLSSSGNYASTSNSTPISLFPKTEGYAGITGTYTSTSSISSGCLSVDPVTWPAGAVPKVPAVPTGHMAAGVRPPVGVAAGATGTMNIPMGVVSLPWPAGATSIVVRGVAAATGPGDPGCAQPTDYTFSYSSPPVTGTVVNLSVPFGSYQVYSKKLSVLTLSATATNATLGEVTGTIITLDARLPG